MKFGSNTPDKILTISKRNFAPKKWCKNYDRFPITTLHLGHREDDERFGEEKRRDERREKVRKETQDSVIRGTIKRRHSG